ncbi:MAG: SMP-30/gluconolactonase/LRE family protein [Burkholderiaceae bacterium]
MSSIHIAHAGPDLLGEAPQWHAREQRLYWVDSFAPALRRLDPNSGACESFDLPAHIGSFVFADDGSIIAGTRAGFQQLHLTEGRAEVKTVADPLARDRRLMLNDGKCDRRGRYWCASVHSDFVGRQAEIFRLDADFSVHRMDGDFIIGNGIAFAPDDLRMYFADSRDETVWVYDFDLEHGQISHKRRFFSTADIEGRVDGAACDTEGNYWCALVHGAAVACIAPSGEMVERIALPVKWPTMVAFGGAQRDALYVTTASTLAAPGDSGRSPHDGALLRIDGLGARGVPEPIFKTASA